MGHWPDCIHKPFLLSLYLWFLSDSHDARLANRKVDIIDSTVHTPMTTKGVPKTQKKQIAVQSSHSKFPRKAE